MSCEYCDIADGKGKAHVLFQDDKVIIAIKDNIITPGQITIFSKEHFTILEMVPNEILSKCSLMANKVSIAVFEGLGAQGTNILIQNGLGAGQSVPHFALEVVPRQENDAIPLTWEPKPLMEDELESTFSALKEEAEKIVVGETPTIAAESTEEEKETMQLDEEKENYLLKSLRRLP